MRATRLGGLAAALGLLAGCGPGEDRLYDVSGTVTYDGKAVPAGIIYFDPDPTGGGTGTQGFANIKDGKFTTAENGQGVRGGGRYEIRVSGYDGKPANEAPLGQPLWVPEHTFKKDLPKENTELTIEVPKRK